MRGYARVPLRFGFNQQFAAKVMLRRQLAREV
jgi:hypothetical protein